jgi:hypothetical protein
LDGTVVLLGLGKLVLLKSILSCLADMEAMEARKDRRPGSVAWIGGAEDVLSVSEGMGGSSGSKGFGGLLLLMIRDMMQEGLRVKEDL